MREAFSVQRIDEQLAKDAEAPAGGAAASEAAPAGACASQRSTAAASVALGDALVFPPPRPEHPASRTTETAAAVFNLGSYKGSSPRLASLTWGAEDLSADIGAETNRGPDGRHTEPFRLARSLCLFAAVAAGVQPVDTVFPAFRDEEGLRRECEEARRDGFTGKMAIHPAQVAVINEVFTPTAEAVKRAEAVIAAFAENPGAGTVGIGGVMYDRPHLERARQLLARAKGFQK